MSKETIAFAADHAGYALKQELIAYARFLGYETIDFGTDNAESYDYPLVAPMIADAIRKGIATRGVVICGSGIGVDIAMNRFRGMRSALCHTPEIATLARTHNNANILSLGAKFIDIASAKECLKNFMETPFSTEERHHRRVNMLDTFM